MSSFDKTDYRADLLNDEHLAPNVRLIDPEHVQKLRTVVSESRRMSDFGSFYVAEKNSGSNYFSVPHLAVDGELFVPLYLVNGLQRSAMSKTVDDLGIDWASFAREAFVHLWSRKVDTTINSKDLIFI